MEESASAPDIDDLLLGALEPDDLSDEPEEKMIGLQSTPGFVCAVRHAELIEASRLRPRSKLEVQILGALGRVEVRLIRADGATRVVRAPSLQTCLAVLADDDAADEAELEVDERGDWVCPHCHGLKVTFTNAGVRGEPKLCPRCAMDRCEDDQDECDELHPPHALD